MSNKQPSTFAKVTKIVVWLMLISIVGVSLISAILVFL